MDGTRFIVSMDEFKLFHGIDRELYAILVRHLARNPLECLYVMALWLWLERGGFYSLIVKILSLPTFLIDELADEAVACIKCINIHFPFSSESSEIPLTQSLVNKDITLRFFHDYQRTAFHEIQGLVNGVCRPSLSDIMEGGGGCSCESLKQRRNTLPGHAASTSSANQVRAPSSVESTMRQRVTNSGVGGDSSQGRGSVNETSRNDRTMFVTFSKGYPVYEREVRQFFTRIFGNCIESLHMQEVRPDEQSLYAKVVFVRPSFIQSILNGMSKAKFNINGKNVWMRKYVPKINRQPLPCGCPSVGACRCPD